MLSCRWCLCGLVWFLPLPCSKIWNCALDNIKFGAQCCDFWHSIFKAITDGKGINWYFNDECRAQQSINHHTKKHGDWFIHPELFAQENPRTTQKIKQQRSEKFKLYLHNVVVLWNIAFYMCLTLRIMVKCTCTIFVWKWIESIA